VTNCRPAFQRLGQTIESMQFGHIGRVLGDNRAMQVTVNGSSGQERIDSWKSIAQYLGRSSRTVQRWHRTYGLPVHRLGGDSSSVFAYTDELEKWLRNRDSVVNGAASVAQKPVLLPPGSLKTALNQSSDSDFEQVVGSEKARAAALVIQANRLWASLSVENLKLIARLFRDAIDLDPDNAEALAGLSYVLLAGGVLGYLRIPDAYVSAKEAMVRAIDLCRDLPEARCAEAWLKMVLERDWKAARRGFDAVLGRMHPSTPGLIGSAMLFLAEAAPRQAVDQLRESVRQFPMNGPSVALYCYSLYLAGDYSEALNFVEETRISGHSGLVLDVVQAFASIRCENPEAYIARIRGLATDSGTHTLLLLGALGYALALNGQTVRANEILDTITQAVDGKENFGPYAIAIILIAMGKKQEAIGWLEQSYRRGSLWSLGFPIDPILQPLRDEPGYRAFLSNYPVPSRRH